MDSHRIIVGLITLTDFLQIKIMITVNIFTVAIVYTSLQKQNCLNNTNPTVKSIEHKEQKSQRRKISVLPNQTFQNNKKSILYFMQSLNVLLKKYHHVYLSLKGPIEQICPNTPHQDLHTKWWDLTALLRKIT